MELEWSASITLPLHSPSISHHICSHHPLSSLPSPPSQVLFLTSVLCHNRSSDHAELFLAKGGVAKLYKLAALPNFPIDFPTMSSSTTLASIYGAILVRRSM